MSDYSLLLKINASNRQQLDDLVITFESVNENLDGIKDVDVFLLDESRIDYACLVADELQSRHDWDKNEFLQRWVLDDEQMALLEKS